MIKSAFWKSFIYWYRCLNIIVSISQFMKMKPEYHLSLRHQISLQLFYTQFILKWALASRLGQRLNFSISLLVTLKSHKSCKHQWSGFNSYATVYDIHDVKVGLQSSPQTISNNKSQTGLLYIWNMSADDKNLALSSIELEIKCILSYLIKEFKFLSFHLWVVCIINKYLDLSFKNWNLKPQNPNPQTLYEKVRDIQSNNVSKYKLLKLPPREIWCCCDFLFHDCKG